MSHYKFAINTCPLCNQELKVVTGLYASNYPARYQTENMIWECPTYVSLWTNESLYRTHYQVEWDRKSGFIMQHMVTPPYFLDTPNTDWLTRINVVDVNGHAQFIAAVPQLHPDTPEALLERVRTLVIFS